MTDFKKICTYAEDLIEIIQKVENKSKQHPLTREEFLKFLDDVKEKNSFILEEVDSIP